MRKCITPIMTMLLCIYLFSNDILAQNAPNAYFNTEPSFTSAPLSPNAAACGLHAVVPRDLSVGLPSIDIPVCMLEDVDISVPVTLQYHPDAVKPDEYPGWVGLGWNLKAGGSIVRITKGKYDEENDAKGYYYGHNPDPDNTGFYDITNPDPNSFFNSDSPLRDSEWNTISSTDILPEGDTEGNFEDYEPDEFIFNFAGYSGKFYFGHLGEWIFTTNSGEHFEMTRPDALANDFSLMGSEFGLNGINDQGHGFTSFTITTNDGTKYTFGGTSNSVEYTRTVNKDNSADYEIFPTAWHLTSIESINGNIVNFAYQRYGAIFKKSQNVNLYNEYYCPTVCLDSNFEYLYDSPTTCYYNLYNNYHIIYPAYLNTITGTDGKCTPV